MWGHSKRRTWIILDCKPVKNKHRTFTEVLKFGELSFSGVFIYEIASMVRVSYMIVSHAKETQISIKCN